MLWIAKMLPGLVPSEPPIPPVAPAELSTDIRKCTSIPPDTFLSASAVSTLGPTPASDHHRASLLYPSPRPSTQQGMYLPRRPRQTSSDNGLGNGRSRISQRSTFKDGGGFTSPLKKPQFLTRGRRLHLASSWLSVCGLDS